LRGIEPLKLDSDDPDKLQLRFFPTAYNWIAPTKLLDEVVISTVDGQLRL
jgi:hypothetical protein